jgi:hypothetical protein
MAHGMNDPLQQTTGSDQAVQWIAPIKQASAAKIKQGHHVQKICSQGVAW